MIRFVSMTAIAIALATPAFAFDLKANVGIGQLQSSSTGGAAGGGISVGPSSAHQDAASAGTAGAQLQVKPSGVTVLTQQNSAISNNQSSHGLAGGLSFSGTQNSAVGAWTGLAGVIKF